MSNGSRCGKRSKRSAEHASAAAGVLLLLVGACGEMAAPDDAGFHSAVRANQNGAEVTFDATVESAPQQVGSHEHLEVVATTGESLEIDHNVDLAQWVPANTGDHVVVHGQLYIDPGPRIGVHCTHAKTSSGCPVPGWIELGTTYYQ